MYSSVCVSMSVQLTTCISLCNCHHNEALELLHHHKVKKKESEVAQSCPTLCNPVDCSLLWLLRPWDFPGKITWVGCHFLLQRILLTQGSNPCLPQCRQTPYVWATREVPHSTPLQSHPCPLPQALILRIHLFLTLYNLWFQEHDINGIIQFIIFWHWLFPLCITLLRLIQINSINSINS